MKTTNTPSTVLDCVCISLGRLYLLFISGYGLLLAVAAQSRNFMPGQGSGAWFLDTQSSRTRVKAKETRHVYKLSAGSGERAEQTPAPPSRMSVIYTAGGCPAPTSQSQLRQLPAGLEGES